MTTADWFMATMMVLNACAALAFGYQGQWWKAYYWCSAFQLNVCVFMMRG